MKPDCVHPQASVFGMSTINPVTDSKPSPLWFCTLRPLALGNTGNLPSCPGLGSSGNQFHDMKSPKERNRPLYWTTKPQNSLSGEVRRGLVLLSFLSGATISLSPKFLVQGAVFFASFWLSVHIPLCHSPTGKQRLPIPDSTDILASACPLWATTHHKLGHDIQLCPGCMQIS